MDSRVLDWLRRRPLVGIAGSLALHLALIGTLVWVKAPSTDLTIKRGEPLFVELPQADEEAQRGLPAGRPAAEPPKRGEAARPAPPKSPPVAKAQPAPKPAAPTAPPPAPTPEPRAPEPPRVASAPPVPKPEAPEPAPAPPAAVPPAPPAAAAAPKPAEPPKEAAPDAVGPGGGPKVAAVPDVRSALGRGGPGGAGGRGEGRAGIEGEPIPLDSKDPRHDDYLDRVRRLIKAKWVYPCVRDDATGRCEYKSAQLEIEFGILKDGRVPFVTVRRQSGLDIYDAYAVNAIKLASPFPPVPDAMTGGRKGIPILATFSYIVESSLTNLLR